MKRRIEGLQLILCNESRTEPPLCHLFTLAFYKIGFPVKDQSEFSDSGDGSKFQKDRTIDERGDNQTRTHYHQLLWTNLARSHSTEDSDAQYLDLKIKRTHNI